MTDTVTIIIDSRGKIILDDSNIEWKDVEMDKEYQDILRFMILDKCNSSWLSLDDLYYGSKYLGIYPVPIECMCEDVENRLVSQETYNNGKIYVSELSEEIVDEISSYIENPFWYQPNGIINALESAPDNIREFMVFRNVVGMHDSPKPGDEFVEKSYMTCSHNPRYLSGIDNCCIIVFTIKKDMKCLFVEDIGSRTGSEILTYSGLIFRISEVDDISFYDYNLRRPVMIRVVTSEVIGSY